MRKETVRNFFKRDFEPCTFGAPWDCSCRLPGQKRSLKPMPSQLDQDPRSHTRQRPEDSDRVQRSRVKKLALIAAMTVKGSEPIFYIEDNHRPTSVLHNYARYNVYLPSKYRLKTGINLYSKVLTPSRFPSHYIIFVDSQTRKS